MYLSGSKWSMRKKRRRPPNPWRIVILIGLIGAAFYFERVIVPSVPPLFVPTSTPTRSSAAVLLEAQSLFQAGKLSQAETAYEEAISVDPKQVNNYIDLARIQALSGELDKAETSARDALLIDSNSAAAQAMLAWVLDLKANQAGNDQDRLKFLDQAQQAIDRALKHRTRINWPATKPRKRWPSIRHPWMPSTRWVWSWNPPATTRMRLLPTKRP
jgi:tetratricopeptide (TPR) repeat protein